MPYLGVSCGRAELARRDADKALEVMGELALVREPGVRGDLGQWSRQRSFPRDRRVSPGTRASTVVNSVCCSGLPHRRADRKDDVLDRDDESRPSGRRGRPARAAGRKPRLHDRAQQLPQVRYCLRRELRLRLVGVTPRPAFPGLIRGDHGVRGRLRVSRGVPTRGAVTATYVAARQTQAQVNPRRPRPQALIPSGLG